MSVTIPPNLDEMYHELDVKVNEYFRAWWHENNVEEAGDYISSWALVANFGNLDNIAACGYIVETFPSSMPPHTIKGLFREGVDWVVEKQESDSEDD